MKTETRHDEEDTSPGQLLGTVGYMSPEQVRGHALDGRSDVFSLGVVLYELLTRTHPFRRATEIATLTALLEEEPADVASVGSGVSPAVGGIVRRCLAKDRKERYGSCRELIVALETALERPRRAARVEPAEERSPYPGLSSFGEADADRFFGREAEVEALWSRLRDRRLLAVIGPSGAGKTSFVRAGVVASRPSGWAALVCTPGAQPLRNLAQALVPELSGDTEALQRLVGLEDPETAFELVERWRSRHGDALLVLDQFEELFTLCAPEVRELFAELLGRLARDTEVHVLLSLRDDFLMRCGEHEGLKRVFTELTPLLPLEGAGLRRALVEPAMREGCSFEDDALVDEMVSSVEGARAGLPLLAFAAARLWDMRDRERRVLTRAAYERMGGVAGALAQHAEATLERTGVAQSIVREIFRNLVTPEGTRAVRERGELLSVFGDERGRAGHVLDTLIDARLLTSYEAAEPAATPGADAETADEGSTSSAPGERTVQRIEVIHESLLSAWPRLVLWQTQDEEGALQREQLRQAARLWEEKGRPDELLWTGRTYEEHRVWRRRYTGGLTDTEDAYAVAMEAHASRQRRRRRLLVSALLVTLTVGLAIVGSLWARSERARQVAQEEARQREAAQLLALGQARLAEEPTEALAFALASLERADNAPARRFAVEALWQGPPLSRIGQGEDPWDVVFSPDGRWAAISGSKGVFLWPRDGGSPRQIAVSEGPVAAASFGGDSRLLATWPWGDPIRVTVRSLPDGTPVRTFELPQEIGDVYRRPVGIVLASSRAPSSKTWFLERWPLDTGEQQILGRIELSEGLQWWVDDAHGRLLELRGGRLTERPLDAMEEAPRLLWHAPSADTTWLHVPPHDDAPLLIGSGVRDGVMRLWPVSGLPSISPRLLHGAEPPSPEGSKPSLSVDPTGRFVSTPGADHRLLWDLAGPPDALPQLLRSATRRFDLGYAAPFSADGAWMAVGRRSYADLWPMGLKRSYVLPFSMALGWADVTPDGRTLVAMLSDEQTGGEIRLWPLSPEAGDASRVLYEDARLLGGAIRVDPRGRFVAASLKYDGQVVVVPLDGGTPRFLEGFGWTYSIALDADGRRLATQFVDPAQQRVILRVWDLEAGRSWDLDPRVKDEECLAEGEFSMDYVAWMAFAPDGTLVADTLSGLRAWADVERGASRRLRAYGPDDCHPRVDALSPDGRLLATVVAPAIHSGDSSILTLDLESGEERRITTHGTTPTAVAFDPSGTLLVSGDASGVVRVGPITGEEPHLLYGHSSMVFGVSVTHDGRYVIAGGGALRLWPLPEGPPLHTRPHEELVAKLRSLTNLRVVEAPASPSGYDIEPGPFPGWAHVPEW